jgi:hypothetical protein
VIFHNGCTRLAIRRDNPGLTAGWQSAHVYRSDLRFQGFDTLCEIRLVLDHAGVYVDLASRLGGFQSLFQKLRLLFPLAQSLERAAQVVLGLGPVERNALARQLDKCLSIEVDGLQEGSVIVLLLTVIPERSGITVEIIAPEIGGIAAALTWRFSADSCACRASS